MPLINEAGAGECDAPWPRCLLRSLSGGERSKSTFRALGSFGWGSIIGRGSEGKERRRLGLVGGGLVFFDRRQRNLGGSCSRVPAEDRDGECAHHKENQAGRG